MTLPIDPAAARSVVRTRVRFGETDLMGIVHHASYVSYFELARVEWLRRRGVSYASWTARGLHLAVVELDLKYRAPARFDDELDVETTLAEVRAASLRFAYRIVRAGADGHGALCADGGTRLACVDDRGTLRRFTSEIIEVLGKGE
jgi:acyl-CoA thioester hydrolase